MAVPRRAWALRYSRKALRRERPTAGLDTDGLFVARTGELPHFRIRHTETLSPHTAHGIKGVGEGGAIAPAGAIVNAINDALAPLGTGSTTFPPRRSASSPLWPRRARIEARGFRLYPGP